jgi:hypothetical protein
MKLIHTHFYRIRPKAILDALSEDEKGPLGDVQKWESSPCIEDASPIFGFAHAFHLLIEGLKRPFSFKEYWSYLWNDQSIYRVTLEPTLSTC